MDLRWTKTFETQFAPQLSAIVDALEKRLLPAFAEIDNEANAVAKEVWESASASATEYDDPADFAEAAEQAGMSHYFLLDGIRQGMLNLFAVALYHMFEQQVARFHRRELLNLYDWENNDSEFRMRVFKKRLNGDFGINITTFPSWETVDELRLVANTVKHAEGGSAKDLFERRPDLFKPHKSQLLEKSDQLWEELFPSSLQTGAQVSLPLAGEGLYISLQDVKNYRDAVLQFWGDLANAMHQQS